MLMHRIGAEPPTLSADWSEKYAGAFGTSTYSTFVEEITDDDRTEATDADRTDLGALVWAWLWYFSSSILCFMW
jgi:hypothetical protein